MRGIATVVAGLALALGLLCSSGRAGAQANRAVEVCAKAALREFLILKRVISQHDVRDRRGRVVAREVVMDVNATGKTQRVNCVYRIEDETARLERVRPGTDLPGADPRAAVPACTRAVKRQGLLLRNVVEETDIRNRRREVTGRAVLLDVYLQGRPTRIVCEYDYASRVAGLELARKQLR